MLCTVAWFLWNPVGWKFEWEPVVVFLFALAGFITTEVANGCGKIPPLIHPNDYNLFKNLIELLPSSGPIEFIRRHDFIVEFDRDILKPFKVFIHEWDNAEHEFIDTELEEIRCELYKAVTAFNTSIGKFTSPNPKGYQAVRYEECRDDPNHEKRFREEAEIINNAADKVVEFHQQLIRKGRAKLDLDIENGKREKRGQIYV